MKKILLTGANGMLGKHIIEELCRDSKNDVFAAVYGKTLGGDIKQIVLDLTDTERISKVLNDIKPDLIIHCAANVNLEDCEKNKDYTRALHVEASKQLALYKPNTAKIIYVSTDSVFNKMRGDCRETDSPEPLNYYALTKYEGEIAVQQHNPNSIIIRTNIYGFNSGSGNSLFEWAIRNLKVGKTIDGFQDVFFNPLYTRQLSVIVSDLLKEDHFRGIIHVGSDEHVNKYEFLALIAEKFGLSSDLIKATSVENISMNVPRPKNTTLNTEKMRNILGHVPRLKKGIEELFNDYSEISA